MSPNEISTPSTETELSSGLDENTIKNPAKPAKRKRFEPEIREHVIKAATRAIESKGLDGIKARPIAQRAGISVGSIYNLFGDLDELTRIVNGRTYDASHPNGISKKNKPFSVLLKMRLRHFLARKILIRVKIRPAPYGPLFMG